MSESYSNAISPRCKGQGGRCAAQTLLLQEQFACGSQFFASGRVDLRIG